jgi:hypothetical protein
MSDDEYSGTPGAVAVPMRSAAAGAMRAATAGHAHRPAHSHPVAAFTPPGLSSIPTGTSPSDIKAGSLPVGRSPLIGHANGAGAAGLAGGVAKVPVMGVDSDEKPILQVEEPEPDIPSAAPQHSSTVLPHHFTKDFNEQSYIEMSKVESLDYHLVHNDLFREEKWNPPTVRTAASVCSAPASHQPSGSPALRACCSSSAAILSLLILKSTESFFCLCSHCCVRVRSLLTATRPFA